jgi:1,4-dihydroxy-2-naphthoyl-CoA hydrolase
MRIWKQDISLSALTAASANTAVSHLGIEFVEVGDDFLVARVPVNRQTCQPYGLLHGGVSVALAETLGSIGAAYCVPAGTRVVGLEVNANHLRAVSQGWVTATARPVHLGRRTQVWQIELRDDQGKAVCASRLTMAVLEPD